MVGKLVWVLVQEMGLACLPVQHHLVTELALEVDEVSGDDSVQLFVVSEPNVMAESCFADENLGTQLARICQLVLVVRPDVPLQVAPVRNR